VIDDPGDEVVSTTSVNRGLSGRHCFITNDRHRADHVALDLNVAARPMLDIEQRPLRVAVLQVLDIHTDIRLKAVVNKVAAASYESERRIVDSEHSAPGALIEVPIDRQSHIVDVHGNIVQRHAGSTCRSDTTTAEDWRTHRKRGTTTNRNYGD